MITTTRETFTISRQLEYLSENELTKQLGYSRELWPLVLVKELIDNSVDNAEEIGVQPEVAVTIEDSSDEEKVQTRTSDDGLPCKVETCEKPRFVLLTVSDNGSGIDPETVEGMVDFENRTSSREAWRSVMRDDRTTLVWRLFITHEVIWSRHTTGMPKLWLRWTGDRRVVCRMLLTGSKRTSPRRRCRRGDSLFPGATRVGPY